LGENMWSGCTRSGCFEHGNETSGSIEVEKSPN
jgi:hypothetical protein